ncbi:hypothetical protein HDV06_001949 [Boothiomyces sp. JEL0866]|nr:hypothetical protein HDV06_001949 [Boothiomyces sp. JEL0866]
MKTVRVDFTSDVICPWCYVGKKHLEAAMKHFPDIQFDVRFHPFQLNPALPIDGKDKVEMYEQRFGKERFQLMSARIKQVGEPLGIHFNHAGMVANTLNAHRLIHFATQNGIAAQVKNELLSAYHEKAQNIGDFNVLGDCYQRAGGNKEQALEYLKSDEGKDQVNKECREAQLRGIHGVPYIQLNGVHVEDYFSENLIKIIESL